MIDINVIVLGIIISIIYFEITEISPGGLVVPGLLALHYDSPIRIGYTIVLSLVVYFICKLLSKKILIFGRRRFALLIILSLLLNLIISFIFKTSDLSILSSSLIGYTIAGLIANDFYKQGVLKTLPSIAIVTSIVIGIELISRTI